MEKRKGILVLLASIFVMIIAAVVIILLSGYKIYVKKPYTKVIETGLALTDRESYQKDFEFLYTEIRDSYVNLAYKEDLFGFDWSELYKEYSEKLGAVKSEVDFYKLCREFITELKDGHLFFSFYDRDIANKVLPYIDEAVYALNIRLIENKPFIFFS